MDITDKDTRQHFIDVAGQLFAERGFYGVSIAAIAAEVGLTKQALLHHFGSKDKLYGEVLAQVSQRFMAVVEESDCNASVPELRLQQIFAALFDYMARETGDARIIMRELLDNPDRAAKNRKWYLRPFVDLLTARARQSEALKDLPEPELFAAIYQTVGGINCFAISRPALAGMYGRQSVASITEAYPLVVEGMLGLAFYK